MSTQGCPTDSIWKLSQEVAGGCGDSCWRLAPASPARPNGGRENSAAAREAAVADVLRRCADAGRQRALCEQLPGSRALQAARRPPCRKQHRIRVSAVASAVRSSSLVGTTHSAAAERTSSAQFSQHSRSAASSGLRPARVICLGRRWGHSGQRGPCPGRGKGTWRCAATPDRAR